MTDQPATTIGFSHPMPGLAMELGAVLGPGVYVQSSTEWSISLDRSRVNLGYVSGLLGDRGWEMFAVETRLQPGAMSPAQVQTNWYFKRPTPDVAANATSPGLSTAAAPTAAPFMPTAAAAAPAAYEATPMSPPSAAPIAAAPTAYEPTPAAPSASTDPTAASQPSPGATSTEQPTGWPAPPSGPSGPTGG
jgi:hypothetical protein